MVQTRADILGIPKPDVSVEDDLSLHAYEINSKDGPVVTNDVAYQSALLGGYVDDSFEALEQRVALQQRAIEATDADTVAQQSVDKYVDTEALGLIDIATLSQDPDLIDEDAQEATAQILLEGEQSKGNATAFDEKFVEIFSPEMGQRDKAVALQLYVQRRMVSHWENMDKLDVAKSLPRFFVPLGEMTAVDSALELIGFEDIDQAFGFLYNLEPEEGKVFVDAVFDTFEKNEVNDLIRIRMLDVLSGGQDLAAEKFFAGVDVATILPLFGAMGKAANTFNMLHKLKATKNTKAVEGAVAAAAENSGVAAKMNTTPVEAQASMSAMTTAEFFEGSVDGASAGAQALVEVKRAEVASKVEQVRTAPIGILREDELKAIEKATEDKLTEVKNFVAANGGKTEDVVVEGSTITKTGISLDIRTAKGKINVPVEVATRSLEGFMPTSIVPTIRNYVATPLSLFKGFTEDLVNTATFISFQNSRNRSLLQAAGKAAYKGLNTKSIGKVDEILALGDEQATVYKYRELKDLHGLTDKEAASYFAVRDLIDENFWLTNNAFRDSLVFEGYDRFIRVVPKGGDESRVARLSDTKAFIKVQDDLPSGVTTVWSAEKGEAIPVDKVLRERIADGRVQVGISNKPFRVQQDGVNQSFDVIVHSPSQRSPLPSQVMHRPTGYVPRAYKDAFYVVSKKVQVAKNGGKVETQWITERLASRLDDAEQVKLTLQAADGEGEYLVRKSSALGVDEMGTLALSAYGGPVTSSRATRPVLFGVNGADPVRVNVAESLERMMGHVANVTTMNTFKMQAVDKFLNTYGQYLKANPKTGAVSIYSEVDPSKVARTADVANIKKLQEWLRVQTNLDDRANHVWRSTLQSFAEGLENVPGSRTKLLEGTRKAALSFSSVDPWGATRAAAFHSMLGAYNPVQLLVQAMGFTVAAAIDPVHVLSNTQRATALSAAVPFVQRINNLEGLRHVSKRMYLAAGFKSAEDMEDAVIGLRKSGLLESTRTGSDVEAALHGMSIDAGALRRLVNGTKEGSTAFFRAGESWNRIYSFSAAYREWRAANKGVKFTGKHVDEVTKNSLKFSLNLNRPNAAAWQDGFTGTVTQFLQINHKAMSTLLGTDGMLTRGERAYLLTGQLAMFGAAGVPLKTDTVADELMMALNPVGFNTDNFTEQELQEIRGIFRDGIVGILAQEIFGENIEVTGRAAIGGGLEGLVTTARDLATAMTQGRVSDFSFSAPGLALANRVTLAATSLANVFSTAGVDWNKQDYLRAMGGLSNLFSSSSNMFKAYLAERSNGQVYNRRGELLFQMEPEEMSAIPWMAMGLQNKKELEIYRNMDIEKRRQTVERGAADVLQALIVSHASSPYNDKTNREFDIRKEAILHSFNDAAKLRIVQRASSRVMKDRKSMIEEKLVRRVLEGFDPSGTSLIDYQRKD